MIVGDIDPAAIEAKIKAKFADWKAKARAAHAPRTIMRRRSIPSR